MPLADVTPVLGFAVADYADFYASEHHATNAGLILRPDSAPLRPNWKSIPVGYYSRAAGLVASGTPVRRPSGVLDAGTYAPSARLDFEAEVAFVIGAPNAPGEPIAVSAADEHVFGVCLLDDWSARDIQAFESAPLGPLLGKSFATSISPWITPLAALGHARLAPEQDPAPLPHLAETDPPHGLALDLEIRINGALVARPHFADMYWSYAQLLAHLTSNGAAVRTGDVLASGTVSGPVREQRGCLLELTWNGAQPITLDDGTARSWLLDGDEVTISATAGTVTLGDVRGRIVSA
jgi:fumarylacetoacetase